jgi:hypothetical protein
MKKISCYLFLTVLLCVSCVKEEDVQDPVAPVTQTETPTGVTLPSGVILPKSIIKTDTKGDVSATNYRYTIGNKISNIDYGWRNLSYTYNNDLITEQRDSNGDAKTDYTYDDKGRLISEVTIYKGDLSSKFKTTYTYNPDETILIQTSVNDLKSNYSTLYTYSKGNLIKSVSTFDELNTKTIQTDTYEYDSSNNLFKNIVGFSKFNFVVNSASNNNPIKRTIVRTSVNNVTGVVEPTINIIYTWEYVYDVTKSYPVEIKQFIDKDLSSTTKINY